MPLTLIPALSLLAGVAFGLALAPGDVAGLLALERAATAAMACGVLLALLGPVVPGLSPPRAAPGASRTLIAGVALAFAAGGTLLAAHAWQDAWQPPLRQAFDQIAGPDDGIVCELSGVLRADAALAADGEGVSLSLWATRIAIRARTSGRQEEPVPATATRGERTPTVAQPTSGGVLLQVGGDLAGERVATWRAGRRVRMTARLRLPQAPRNPGAADSAKALARRGTVLVGSVKSGALVEVDAPGTWWQELASAARGVTRDAVGRHVGRWDHTAGAIVTAILIGDRTSLAVDVQRALQAAGTYHVIAISGGNIAILAAVTLTLFRWGGLLGRAAMVVAIVLFLLYGGVVTGGPSVSRAITVAVLAFAARALDLRIGGGRSLLLAAAFLAASDPLTLADPGFLLSFGATAGILALSPLVPRVTQPFIQSAVSLLLASIAAELALLPIVAWFFGRLTVAGLVLNFAAIPLMAIVQIAGMVVVPLAWLSPPAADVVGWVAARSAGGLVASASLVEWMPRLAWRVAAPSLSVVCLYYVASAFAVVLTYRFNASAHNTHASIAHASIARAPRVRLAVTARRLAVLVTGVTGLWIAAEPWRWWAASGDGRLHVTFLDVGQGDAALLRFPRGATLLVDTGGAAGETYDIGDRVVTPALLHFGIHRLGSLALTHWDTDHAGGSRSVVRDLAPFDVWEGVAVPRLALRQDTRAAAAGVGSRWVTVRDGDVTEIDGVQVRVLHPPPPDWERQDPRNDDSIVLDVRMGDVSIVLTGDVGREVERTLVDRLDAGRLDAGSDQPATRRVLKVPHHGSLTSSSAAFVEHLRPMVAIISAGRGNPFGHPARAVLQRYESIGTSIYRTDQDGAITVSTDGRHLEVATVSGRTAYWP